MATVDLTGQSFARLTVLASANQTTKSGKRLWLCRCTCGREVTRTTDTLRSGNTKSCGCLRADTCAASRTKHGMSGTAIYRIWCLMRARCHDETSQDYANYGGRGIVVCEQWRNSFEAFVAAVGERPSLKHSLDRIDVNKGYEPGNVRWSEQKTQCNNKRSNTVIEFKGESLTVSQWAERIGVNQRVVANRLRRGFAIEKVLSPKDMRQKGGLGAVLSSEQGTYYAMLRRCTKPGDEAYLDYGGRGIGVSDRWQGTDGYANFIADMGPRPPGCLLDRIDVNGDYSPENCRWVSAKESARNTRHNRYLTLNGETHCISEWAEILGIPAYTISTRLQRNWTLDRVLCKNPPRVVTKQGRAKSLTYNGVTKTHGEWAKEFGITARALQRRLALGWTVEDALSTPARIRAT